MAKKKVTRPGHDTGYMQLKKDKGALRSRMSSMTDAGVKGDLVSHTGSNVGPEPKGNKPVNNFTPYKAK